MSRSAAFWVFGICTGLLFRECEFDGLTMFWLSFGGWLAIAFDDWPRRETVKQ